MALPLRAALRSAAGFAFRNPSTLFAMAKHAIGMKIAIPLDAVRWFIANTPPSQKAPQDITITSRPPAVAIGMTVELMGTPLRANTKITVEAIEVSSERLQVSIALNDTELKVLGESSSPIAGLLRSGMLDLSKPGNLLKFMPKRPDVLVDAHDNVIVLDLFKNPRIRANDAVRRTLAILSPVLQVSGLSTDGDYLIVSLHPNAGGVQRAFAAVKQLAP